MQPVTLFKCLSDPTRLRIVLLLVERPELCVCELVEVLALGQPKISRHLALLRSSGLLADRRQGQWVYYRLHPQLPDWATAVLQQASTAAGTLIDADLQRLAACCVGPDQPARCTGNSSGRP